MTTWGAIWAELRKPNAFRDDWYIWMVVALAHWVLGYQGSAVVSAAHLKIFGEFQDKVTLWVSIAVAYAVFEIIQQKISKRPKNWFDAAEDWVFVAMWGAAPAIFLYDEVEPKQPELLTSMEFIPPFMAIFWGHILAGVVVRVWRKAG